MTQDPQAIDLQIVADTIKEENGLIHQRLLWGLTLQGFMFASYFWDGSDEVEPIKFALPWLGAILGLSSVTGSIFAHCAVERAIRTFNELQTRRGGVLSVNPAMQVPRLLLPFAPHFFIPFAVTVFWIVVWFSNHGSH
ncbi:hypothetical protein ACFOGJ_29935 [Marinibaculum pumilum]|uniref:Uncharacterized protein n=1 Tax=Marinibaculum pumilum TaxID=1766165 RepID=A0ABV7L9Z6_9PROT